VGVKRDDPDTTLPGRTFGHVELDLGLDATVVPRPVHSGRSEDVTQASERTRAAVGDPRVAAMRELYAEGDASGALFIALSIAPNAVAELAEGYERDLRRSPRQPALPEDDDTLLREPGAHVPAWRRSPRRFVPHVLKSREEIAAMPIDHRGGFLLAHADGVQTVDEIFDVCAMPEEEAVQLIEELIALGAIALEPELGTDTPAPGSRRAR